MSKGFASSYRIVLLAAGLLLSFGVLGARLVWLHVLDRDRWMRTVAKARHQLIVETAKRGDILDRRGSILATSRSTIVLGVDPSMVRPQDEARIPQLASMIGVPESEVRQRFTTKYREVTRPNPAAAVSAGAGLVFNLGPLSEKPAHEPAGDADGVVAAAKDTGPQLIQWAKLRDDVSEELYSQIAKLGFKCLTVDRVYQRSYPNNQLAAHLIGYVDREQRPVAGMEYFADFYLRGQNGWRVGERDGRNRELAQFRTREVPRSDGYSVVLSIDSAVQDIIEQELATIAQRFSPQKATIIVSDPRTGFIHGLANYPTFNLNEYNQVPKHEQERLKNIAVADIYEPGSVFKIVAVAGALEEGLIRPDTRFNCTAERIEYRGRVLKLPGEDHRFEHDELTVAEIMSHSSNRGAAQMGMLLGEDKLYRYARGFGFGDRLDFPVGGEVGGILARPERWNPIDITRIPMGHTIAATTLQMHQAMAVIAANGVLLRPQLVREIRDATGEVVYRRTDGIPLGRVVSPRTAQTVAAMLMGVASKKGTAPEAAIDGFEVAGKTGTTQMLIDGKYSERHHVASFVGFFPATAPQVVISVIVTDADARAPGGVAYGRTVAAPSFKRIGEQLIPILEIKPNTTPFRPNAMAFAEGGRR
jgi:cell division protein FtsI/penicillin-binding protein 2